ncbi:MAG: hypothetical protein LBH45_02290 [Campylobacteraceae bacterium]|jgi:hypothetical protein|nr:hypothetical protein [Campylobacteraceae bacterium]
MKKLFFIVIFAIAGSLFVGCGGGGGGSSDNTQNGGPGGGDDNLAPLTFALVEEGFPVFNESGYSVTATQSLKLYRSSEADMAALVATLAGKGWQEYPDRNLTRKHISYPNISSAVTFVPFVPDEYMQAEILSLDTDFASAYNDEYFDEVFSDIKSNAFLAFIQKVYGRNTPGNLRDDVDDYINALKSWGFECRDEFEQHNIMCERYGDNGIHYVWTVEAHFWEQSPTLMGFVRQIARY